MKKQGLTEKYLKKKVKRNYFNSTCCNYNCSINTCRNSNKLNNRRKWNIKKSTRCCRYNK